MKEDSPSHEGMGSVVSKGLVEDVVPGLDPEEEKAVRKGDVGIKGTQADSRPLPRASMKRPQTSGMLPCAPVIPALGRLRQNN